MRGWQALSSPARPLLAVLLASSMFLVMMSVVAAQPSSPIPSSALMLTPASGPPIITLSPNSIPYGSYATVAVSGVQFSTSDTSCVITSSPSGLFSSQSCTVSSGTVTGSFTVQYTSTSYSSFSIIVTGSTADAASATFQITPTPCTSYYQNQCYLTLSQTSATVVQGKGVDFYIYVNGGTVNTTWVSYSGAPAGVWIGIWPLCMEGTNGNYYGNNGPYNWGQCGLNGYGNEVAITTNTYAQPGTYTITFTLYTNGYINPTGAQSATFSLTINPLPFIFGLDVNPTKLTANSGQNVTMSVSVSLVQGAPTPVTLSVTGTGWATSFTSNNANPAYTSTLQLNIPVTTPTGVYSLTVTGTANGQVQSATVSMYVVKTIYQIAVTTNGLPASIQPQYYVNGQAWGSLSSVQPTILTFKVASTNVISVNQTILSSSGVRYWTGQTQQTVTTDGSLIFNYLVQYQITATTSLPSSAPDANLILNGEHVTPPSMTMWVDGGSSISLSANNIVQAGAGERYVLANITDQNSQIPAFPQQATGPERYTVNYTPQYLITMTSSGIDDQQITVQVLKQTITLTSNSTATLWTNANSYVTVTPNRNVIVIHDRIVYTEQLVYVGSSFNDFSVSAPTTITVSYTTTYSVTSVAYELAAVIVVAVAIALVVERIVSSRRAKQTTPAPL